MAQHGSEFRNCQDGFRFSFMQYIPIMHVLFAADNQGKARNKEKEGSFRKELFYKDRTTFPHGWTPHVMNLTYFQAYFHNYIWGGGIRFCNFLVRYFYNSFCALRGFDFLKLERPSIYFYSFLSFSFLLCLMHLFFSSLTLLLNFSCNSDFFLSFSSLFLIAAFVKLK